MPDVETEPGHIFGLYVVGLFDVLGQKDELYRLPGAGDPGRPQDGVVVEYLRSTLGRVLNVRTLFKDHFDAFEQTPERWAAVPQKRAFATNIRHWGMSDSYVVAIPPPDEPDFSIASTLVDVHRMLRASASVWLHAMSKNLPIRGGIELGYAIDVGEREVYGHALAEALNLESKVAEYPRVVVGATLVGLLKSGVGGSRAARRSGSGDGGSYSRGVSAMSPRR